MARRRRNSFRQKDAKGLIALVAALFLALATAVEYIFKAISWGVKLVSNDVKWTSEGLTEHEGNWANFYDNSFHRKVFKYVAIISAIVGLFLLADRPIAGLIFLAIGGISYFIDRDVFIALGSRAKEVIIVTLIASGLISNGGYRKAEIEKVQHEQAEQAKQLQIKIADEKKQVALLDSSNRLVTLGRTAFKKKRFSRANALFDQALTVSPPNEDALFLKGWYFKETKQFDKAALLFARIGSSSEKHDEALVEEGLCLVKKNPAQAVALFREASALNNSRASKLYNKYNPIRRRITGYITRCCDGTSSGARGRGACSHHGGVCNWNDTIYTKSRRYE
jgi:tetratricopeptide (TPR) repeat protein